MQAQVVVLNRLTFIIHSLFWSASINVILLTFLLFLSAYSTQNALGGWLHACRLAKGGVHNVLIQIPHRNRQTKPHPQIIQECIYWVATIKRRSQISMLRVLLLKQKPLSIPKKNISWNWGRAVGQHLIKTFWTKDLEKFVNMIQE